jgi:hypothetical protein
MKHARAAGKKLEEAIAREEASEADARKAVAAAGAVLPGLEEQLKKLQVRRICARPSVSPPLRPQ